MSTMLQQRPTFRSLAEVENVVKTLTTLCHYPNDFKEFPKSYLEMIFTNGQTANCSDHLHPGMTCVNYGMFKAGRQFKTSIKLSMIFILLPALVQSFRKLLNDSETRKQTLIKIVRSTLYLTIFTALPSTLMCVFMKVFGLKMGKRLNVLSMGLGGFIAYLFETPNRHIQLTGFMLPKAIETLFNLLQSRGLYKAKDWHNYAIAVFAWAIIASAALREHLKKQKSVIKMQEKEVDEETMQTKKAPEDMSPEEE